MESIANYKKLFVESFALENSDNIEHSEYNSIPEWDSIGHISLISALEEKYDISFETDDVIDFSSFKKGIEILNKYGVKIK